MASTQSQSQSQSQNNEMMMKLITSNEKLVNRLCAALDTDNMSQQPYQSVTGKRNREEEAVVAVAEAPTGKAKKAKKDKYYVKKPSNAYTLMVAETFKEKKNAELEKNPDWKGSAESFKETNKIASDKWKSFTDAEKQPYVDAHDKLKVKYAQMLELMALTRQKDELDAANATPESIAAAEAEAKEVANKKKVDAATKKKATAANKVVVAVAAAEQPAEEAEAETTNDDDETDETDED